MPSPQPRGPSLLEWHFPEFIQHDRGRGWYTGFIVLAVGMLVLSIWSRQYTAIPVVVLASLILVIRFRRPPANVPVAVYENGMTIGGDFSPWEDFKEFWIVYRPPEIKKVYLGYKTSVRPAHSIDLMDQNPLKVRQIISGFLPENVAQESETTSDQLSRFFKI